MARRGSAFGAALLGVILLASSAIGPALGHDPHPTPAPGKDSGHGPMLGKHAAEAGGGSGPVVEALTVPAGFTDQAVLTGLVHPTVIQFAQDGRVFVAEKRGTIKVFDSLTDTTPTTFVDLQTQVDDYWDRGLLGMALSPTFPADPSVYVLYTYDAPIGGTAPRWSDQCPTPPGPTTDGCVVSGRLSKLQANGNVSTGPEQVLINDWCQQYPSHSIGTVAFGPDGALYASGGDGASFTFADYGQGGGGPGSPTPVNPCADPTNEGGALRSQDLRTMPGGGGGASYSSTVLGDAPVAYWRLGEAGGTTAANQVAGPAGTYVGGFTLGAGGAIADGDTAVALNGSTGYVNVPQAPSLNVGDVFSIELWVKRDTLGFAGDSKLVSKGGGAYFIGFNNDGIEIAQEGVAIIGHSTGEITDTTTWHHVVWTKNGSSNHLYLDGVDVSGSFANSTIANNTSDLHIGAKSNATEFTDGTIDEVAIYNTALTGAQVTAHRAAALGGAPSSNDPAGLNGAVLRLDPATGAAMAGNPNIASPDPNARRVISHGYRNPFRFTFRPGTNELWVGDVGWSLWEEIDLVANPTGGVLNHGWPCYEGVAPQVSYDNLNLPICEGLYAAGTAAAPYFSYDHSSTVGGAACPTANGSAIAGLAFYQGGSYPASFDGGLFFADYSRDCIWFMPAGANGRPNAGAPAKFIEGASNPVNLAIGPGGDLFYPDFDGGTIHRVTFASGNVPPTAVATATPTSGASPLTVAFSGTGSSDPEQATLAYAWDFDGDGTDDATGATPTFTYTTPGTFVARLRVTDDADLSDTDTVTISVDNTPPVPTIISPVPTLTWAVGDPIAFSGEATDGEDGALAASRLSWTVVQHHCPVNPNDCHEHTVQTMPGIATGSFAAPDHDYPSWIELVLTATDSGGLTGTASVRLDPKTAQLSFATVPTGLQLSIGATTSTAPFQRTVIQKSRTTLTAPAQQTVGGSTYNWQSWSDGGARSHDVFPTADGTYTATYVLVPPPADLAVTQTAPLSNGQVRITAVVTNGGPGSAAAVTLKDVLNAKLVFVSATSTVGTCTYASGSRTVTCNIGTRANGAQATVTIVARDNGKGNVTNTVTVTSTTPDPNTANNSKTVTIKLP